MASTVLFETSLGAYRAVADGRERAFDAPIGQNGAFGRGPP
jgi:hypothetical protein